MNALYPCTNGRQASGSNVHKGLVDISLRILRKPIGVGTRIKNIGLSRALKKRLLDGNIPSYDIVFIIQGESLTRNFHEAGGSGRSGTTWNSSRCNKGGARQAFRVVRVRNGASETTGATRRTFDGFRVKNNR